MRYLHMIAVVLLCSNHLSGHPCSRFYEAAITRASRHQINAGTSLVWAPLLGAGFIAGGSVGAVLAPAILFTGNYKETIAVEIISISTIAQGFYFVAKGVFAPISGPIIISQRQIVKDKLKKTLQLLAEIDADKPGPRMNKLLQKSGAKDLQSFAQELKQSNLCPRVAQAIESIPLEGHGLYDYSDLKKIVVAEKSGRIQGHNKYIRYDNSYTTLFMKSERAFGRSGEKQAILL